MTKLLTVRVTRTTYFPVLAAAREPRVSAHHVIDRFVGDLGVGYTPGPPYGRALLTQEEFDASSMARSELRREAAANLYAALDRVRIHGQPPALMLSFDGLESSVLLAHSFWEDVAGSVPGALVAGVPARDAVIFTGSESRSGLEKVRRAVDRVFYAGGPHLLTRTLLVRRQRRWEPLQPAIPRPRTPEPTGPGR